MRHAEAASDDDDDSASDDDGFKEALRQARAERDAREAFGESCFGTTAARACADVEARWAILGSGGAPGFPARSGSWSPVPSLAPTQPDESANDMGSSASSLPPSPSLSDEEDEGWMVTAGGWRKGQRVVSDCELKVRSPQRQHRHIPLQHTCRSAPHFPCAAPRSHRAHTASAPSRHPTGPGRPARGRPVQPLGRRGRRGRCGGRHGRRGCSRRGGERAAQHKCRSAPPPPRVLTARRPTCARRCAAASTPTPTRTPTATRRTRPQAQSPTCSSSRAEAEAAATTWPTMTRSR